MPQALTIKLLQNHYSDVLCLREYLRKICGSGIILEKSGDSESYLSLVATSYVALTEPYDASVRAKFKAGEAMCEIYEVIDRVQVKLFEQAKGRPLNVLTMGYRRAHQRGEYGRADMSRQAITNFFPNTNITALKAMEWGMLLERIGDAAMYHLLLNTSIFVALPNDCFCQLVGTPISELKPYTSGFLSLDYSNVQIHKGSEAEDQRPLKRRRLENIASMVGNVPKYQGGQTNTSKRSVADISFVRARMFYARPVMTEDPQSGDRYMAVGFPPHHILHRLAPVTLLANGDVPSKENIIGRDARHVLKHIFPRQFGLRNPFDPPQSQQGNVYTFESYTVREEEIQLRGNVKTPKRLKLALVLVQQLIRRHCACNYRGLRSMVCPSNLKKMKQNPHQPLDSSVILEMMSESQDVTSITVTQVPLANISTDSHPSLIYKHGASIAEKAVKAKPRFAEFVCGHNEVFRYVQKVTETVIPIAFWGSRRNFKSVMKHVERLVTGRRFETTTLHSVLQQFSTQECDWLLPVNTAARHQRPTVTDALKRRELVEEFLFWYFDSFVIPLIRTVFYATESAAFRQRVLFFRQDDWSTLCRPLLRNLAEGTFKKLDAEEAQDILRQRKLGYSFVRLLPKETGVRPIVNLRRKSSKRQADGTPALSINQVLQAAFQVLTYEKENQPALLGASVFGPNETYANLKGLKTRLMEKHGRIPKLYFVKVDVRTCFDSIEQGKLLEILHRLLSEDGYMIQRFARVLPVAGKIQRTFWRRACPEADHPHFLEYAARLAGMLRHAVFVDQVVYSYEDREEILQLLKEHVTENIVKIGQDYYRQTLGIPQGSVLSTILCSFFYGDLERKHFRFTEDAESMLCRLVDDYLFVTADESKARMFLDMMTAGHPEYGCFISVEKTLTNFDADERVMNRTLPGQTAFPWCGLLIDMRDLSVTADYTRYHGAHLRDTLTVDRGRRPGAAFEYKMLRMARFKSHPIFCDTELNTEIVVHRNIYENFLLAAMKMHVYMREWGGDVKGRFVLRVIRRTIRFAYASIRSIDATRVAREFGATCSVTESAVVWLGTHAFWRVLKQKGAGQVARVLAVELGSGRFARQRARWAEVVRRGDVLERVQF